VDSTHDGCNWVFSGKIHEACAAVIRDDISVAEISIDVNAAEGVKAYFIGAVKTTAPTE
jgi:hypothetical protein